MISHHAILSLCFPSQYLHFIVSKKVCWVLARFKLLLLACYRWGCSAVSHFSSGCSPLLLAVATHKRLWWWLDKKSIRLCGLSCKIITACVCSLAVYFVSITLSSLFNFYQRDIHTHNTICFVSLAITSSGKGMAASNHVSQSSEQWLWICFPILCHHNKSAALLTLVMVQHFSSHYHPEPWVLWVDLLMAPNWA